MHAKFSQDSKNFISPEKPGECNRVSLGVGRAPPHRSKSQATLGTPVDSDDPPPVRHHRRCPIKVAISGDHMSVFENAVVTGNLPR